MWSFNFLWAKLSFAANRKFYEFEKFENFKIFRNRKFTNSSKVSKLSDISPNHNKYESFTKFEKVSNISANKIYPRQLKSLKTFSQLRIVFRLNVRRCQLKKFEKFFKYYPEKIWRVNKLPCQIIEDNWRLQIFSEVSNLSSKLKVKSFRREQSQVCEGSQYFLEWRFLVVEYFFGGKVSSRSIWKFVTVLWKLESLRTISQTLFNFENFWTLKYFSPSEVLSGWILSF